MARKSTGSGMEIPAGIEQTGSEKPEPQRERKRDYPFATDRHLADLTAQRDRIEALCSDQAQQLLKSEKRIAQLQVENARLDEINRGLQRDLKQGGLTVIFGDVMMAVGGGAAGFVSGRLQGVMLAILAMGGVLLLWNSIRNLTSKTERGTSPAEAP